MIAYTLKRLATGIVSLFVLATVTFFLVRLIPGSPFQNGGVSTQVVEAVEEEYGLKEPLLDQYLTYMGNLVQGDLGVSYQEPDTTVAEIIGRTWPVTASLGLVALLASVFLGTGLGILKAVSKKKAVREGIAAGGMLLAGIPNFAAAILLLLVFSVKLRWFPSAGLLTPAHYVLPMISLMIYPMAVISRLTGNTLASEMGKQYVLFARAKGRWKGQDFIYSCPEKCMDPGIELCGTRIGVPSYRKLCGGEHLYHPGAWAGVCKLYYKPGLHADPGADGVYGDSRDPGESCDRPCVHVDGSKDAQGHTAGNRNAGNGSNRKCNYEDMDRRKEAGSVNVQKDVARLVRGNRQALAGCVILGVWILLAILVPLFWPWSYSEQNAGIQNQAISLTHLFGTDKFGRDIFARVWYGAGISLLIGIASALVNGCVGVLYGASAGYAGKYVDMVMMRIADIISSIPSMLYVILITLAAGAGAGSMILGLCVAGWIDMARIVRGEIQRLKETDFAAAARMEGIPRIRILLRHLLPNAAGLILVNLIFLIPQAIFTEAFLSFLGVGLEPPAASLGTIIQEARSQMLVYPNQMVCPLVVLCVMLLALNAVGTAIEGQLRRGKNE